MACVCPAVFCRCAFIPSECLPPIPKHKGIVGLHGGANVGVKNSSSRLNILRHRGALLLRKLTALEEDMASVKALFGMQQAIADVQKTMP